MIRVMKILLFYKVGGYIMGFILDDYRDENKINQILEEHSHSEQLLKEKEFQKQINESESVQMGIAEILLDKKHSNYEFVSEVEYINGITSDFTIINPRTKEILAVIECKRPDIGVTEYVRGIGQVFQYEYFAEKNILPKKYTTYFYNTETLEEFKNAIVIPSSFYQNTQLNIANFKYPKSSILIEINLKNMNARKINSKILTELKGKNTNTISISPYYIRDNRIFEYYLLLKYIRFVMVAKLANKINRKEANVDLKKIQTINNGNWRNAFITLSNLGFIDKNNTLTKSGNKMAAMNLVEFTSVIYTDYIKAYVDEIMSLFVEKPNLLKSTNSSIAEAIKNKYKGKDILYLTESKGRYISSWLNIMRDDLNCISFQPRTNDRNIKYIPADYLNESLKNKIRENSIGEKYNERFDNLTKNGEFKLKL